MLELDTKDKRNKFYHSTDWNQLRMKAYLRDNRECQHCKAEGKVVKGITYIIYNLLTLDLI